MKKKSYFIKSMFSYIVMFVVLGIAMNMFSFTASAQITWPNALIYTQSGTVYDGVSAKSVTTFLHDNDADKVYTLVEGNASLLHTNVDGVVGVGGIICDFENGYYTIADLDDLSIRHQNTTGIVAPTSAKGDTSLYYYAGVTFLKIGTADPVELVGISGTVKAYLIMNGHIFVYTYLSSTQTTLWDVDVNNISNPTSQVINEAVYFVTFLDEFQVKFAKVNSQYHAYFYQPSAGWQQIDDELFEGILYGEYALSYYGENNDICLTCLKTSNGDLRQIYTEGFPSDENDILTFSFPEQTGDATINAINHTVNVEVANGTDVSNLIASFTLSEGATAYVGGTLQQSGVTQNDFTNSVIYTIHAENAETQTWTVNVTEEQLSDANDILTFSFPEQTANAVINSTNKTVDIQVANGTILTNLVASFTLSAGATAYIGETEQQSGVTQNDFTNSVIYTIHAENAETQTWTVTVSIETSIETTDNSQLSIYPNPTSGWLKIETTEIIEKVTISDLSGRIMLTTDQSEIDLSQIANGSYLISIETHETVYTEKILITR